MFVAAVFMTILLLAAAYSGSGSVLGEALGQLLAAAIIAIIAVLSERFKPEKDETPRVRARCPFCNAIYAYSLESAIETGTYRCQNCARVFTVQPS